jgi:hypothetical protein
VNEGGVELVGSSRFSDILAIVAMVENVKVVDRRSEVDV